LHPKVIFFRIIRAGLFTGQMPLLHQSADGMLETDIFSECYLLPVLYWY